MLPTFESVIINGMRYSVNIIKDLRSEDDKDKLDGQIAFGYSRIELEEDQSPQAMLVTLLHEVVHGIYKTSNREQDEAICELISYGMAGFLLNNPDVLRWIKTLEDGDIKMVTK